MRILVILLFFLAIFSCKPQKEEVRFEYLKTNLPYKSAVLDHRNDSTLVYFLVPQKIRLINNYKNDILLGHFFFSHNGGAIMNRKYGAILEYKDDKLGVIKTRNLKISNTGNKTLEIYVCYPLVVNKSKFNLITRDTTFSGKYWEKPVYNINKVKEEDLNSLIPIEKRGFLYFSMSDLSKETMNGIPEAIPVKF